MICVKKEVQLSLRIVCKQFSSDSLVLMIVLSFLLTVLHQQFQKHKRRLIIKYIIVTALRIPCETQGQLLWLACCVSFSICFL